MVLVITIIFGIICYVFAGLWAKDIPSARNPIPLIATILLLIIGTILITGNFTTLVDFLMYNTSQR